MYIRLTHNDYSSGVARNCTGGFLIGRVGAGGGVYRISARGCLRSGPIQKVGGAVHFRSDIRKVGGSTSGPMMPCLAHKNYR